MHKARTFRFLDHINLDRTLKTESEEENQKDKVTLITLHNTKGLEFKRVIITGMESGIFRAKEKPNQNLKKNAGFFMLELRGQKMSFILLHAESAGFLEEQIL